MTDANDRRVGKKRNGALNRMWVYGNQTQILAELDSSGSIVSRFVYASRANVPDYMIRAGVNYKFITDQIGSVRLVVNASNGTIAEKIDYDEFGNVLSDSNPGFQPFGFAGGLYDQDTKLVHFGAREYDPEVGRWLSKDPILFNGGDANLFGYAGTVGKALQIETNLYGYSGTVGKVPQIETNLYSYTMQDPVNFIDPSGLYRSSPSGNYPEAPGSTVDVNVTIGFGIGIQGGVQVDTRTGRVYPYGGFAITTPPGGVSVGYLPNQPPSTGVSCGASIGYGAGAEVNSGPGGGPTVMTPGAAAGMTYTFPYLNWGF